MEVPQIIQVIDWTMFAVKPLIVVNEHVNACGAICIRECVGVGVCLF